MLFLIDIGMVLFSSVNLVHLLTLRKKLDQIIFFLVAFSGIVIFSTCVLSLVVGIKPSGFLLLHSIILIITLTLRRFQRKELNVAVKKNVIPKPVVGYVSVKESLLNDVKNHSGIMVLCFCVVFFLLVSIWLILIVPPNNWDSMTYHLSRVGYWLQQSSLVHFSTHNVRQIISPPNAEILILWPIVFINKTILAGMVQWIAYVGTILIIYGIAQSLSFSLIQSMLAASFWALIPEIMLEATSTQNDLVLTFFLMASIYFFIRGSEDLGLKGLVISGIGIGLAIGTKGTAFLALPGIAAGALFFFLQQGKRIIKCSLIWFLSSLLGIIVFGAYSYIQNYIHYDSLLGPPSFKLSHTNISLSNMLGNLGHISHRFLDITGIPFVKFPGFFNSPIQEDLAGYGVLWLLLALPVFLITIIKIPVQRDIKRIFLIIAGMGYFLSFSYAVNPNPWIFRILIPMTAMISPLVGAFYPKGNRARIVFSIIVVPIAIVTVITCTFGNMSKPLWGENNIFSVDLSAQKFVAHRQYSLEKIYKKLDEIAKPGDRIGLIASGDDWDYPAFGKHFERKVIPLIANKDVLDANIFERYKLDYLIIFSLRQKILNEGKNLSHINVEMDIIPFIHILLRHKDLCTLVAHRSDKFIFARTKEIASK